ncbi:MAG: SpoIID/LytB domain-containing protein [Propionibacteriaceae bacterium]|nr:SpoIID/LytB domain-containing protein [Propionibacteriaceae bacterium]
MEKRLQHEGEDVQPVVRFTCRVLAGVIAAGLGFGLLGAPAANAAQAAAESTVKPVNSTITIVTSGWGHGIGMSQYGAYGAAKAGLSFTQILNFYYPGTTQAKLSASEKIDVLISKANDEKLYFYPASGVTITDTSGKKKVLPVGTKYTLWRIHRSGTQRLLYYKNDLGKYVKYDSGLSATKEWFVSNTKTNTVKLLLPGSVKRTYRGEMTLRFSGNGAVVVNRVLMEDYLRSVVPAEMPASWSLEAVKAQAVAARSYAARYKKNLNGKKPYDICDTTSCQAYTGISVEHANTDKAIKQTAGVILKYKDTIAYTMFSSSNGGYTAKGDYPYLVAKADPYDDKMLNQYKLVTLTTAAIEKKFTTIGKFQSMTFKRDGLGPWGGRVTEVKLTGAKGSKTVSGSSFKSAFGLRERLMIALGGLSTNSENYARWAKDKNVNGTIGVPTTSEKVIGAGLHAQFTGGDLFWTKTTGSKLLSGAILQAYLAEKGPSGKLGWPTSDVGTIKVVKVSDIKSGVEAYFEKGLITCPSKTAKPAQCVVSYG